MNTKNSVFQPIIGMEIHVELKTKSKMFCGCKNDPFYTKEPNSLTCPVCLGLPGALPVPNKKAVEWCILLGLALNCEIPLESKFDRKHYFYPDLAKGYQISQYDQPLCVNGYVDINSNVQRSKEIPTSSFDSNSGLRGIHDAVFPISSETVLGQNSNSKRIRIRRVHMEEDTGKLMHETMNGPTSPQELRGVNKKVTLVDFNRSGVPLVEIVTEPDIRSGEEAKLFLQKLHQIITYLGISEAEMSHGSMRLEPNISIKIYTNSDHNMDDQIPEDQLPTYKVEVKNINSFKFVEKAINYEIKRHIALLEKGETPVQETRGFVESTSSTVSQRIKEEANDYRYFPDPDIPPMKWEKEYVNKLKDQIPELADEKIKRFIIEYKLNKTQAEMITETKVKADFFEQAVKTGKSNSNTICNWIINKKVDITTLSVEQLLTDIQSHQSVDSVSDAELQTLISSVLAEQSKAVIDYKNGKEQAFGFLLGMIMRKAGKKLDTKVLRENLISLLHK
jgi:aspartyl-tRNA(Asn)/glutamyl-tRNA(Gln) amidotransferase subunit B